MSGNNPMTTHRSPQGGFTLIELLVTVTIAVIMATVAVPSFSNYIDNQRVRSGGEQLYGAFQLARSEAVKRNAEVTIATGSSWDAGWTIKLSDGTKIRQHDGLDQLTVLSSTTTSVKFDANGRISGGGTATVEFCDEAKDSQVSRRVVEVTASGRPRLERGASCS